MLYSKWNNCITNTEDLLNSIILNTNNNNKIDKLNKNRKSKWGQIAIETLINNPIIINTTNTNSNNNSNYNNSGEEINNYKIEYYFKNSKV